MDIRVGKRLQELRLAQKLSLENVSNIIGEEISYLRSLENDEVPFKGQVVEKLSRLYKTTKMGLIGIPVKPHPKYLGVSSSKSSKNDLLH